ncbi:MAG: Uma2 family endonuclease [Polyangiales bacterium]
MAVDPRPPLPYRYPARPHPAGELPPVHEALLADETPYEMYDGRLTRVASANPPHAIRHTEVAFVLRANTAPGYISALDLKTRVDQNSEVAPDASIYRADVDPETAGRRLEELVVEVTGRQAFTVVTRKARKLSARGVRRILCVRVKRREVMEWDHAADAWGPRLAPSDTVSDPCLVRPVAVAALLDAAAADDEAARGLLARKTPALVEALDTARGEGVAQGIAQGIAQSVVLVLEARAVPVSARARDTILACRDEATLRAWLGRAATAPSGDALVGP